MFERACTLGWRAREFSGVAFVVSVLGRLRFLIGGLSTFIASNN